MKNAVEEIIKSFNKEEFREFKYFLNRQKNHIHEREDLKIIDLIRKNETASIINKQAFHQTKNRIKKQLELFTAIENIRFENSSKIQNHIETAKYLFRKMRYAHAWDYLFKAEKMAIHSEEYELLNYIYNIQIFYSYNITVPPPDSFSIHELLEKRKRNIASVTLDGNANAAYALLIYELRDRFSGSLQVDIDELVMTIFSKYDIDDTIIQQDKLKIYYKIVMLVCRALREKRDYESLTKYSENSYNNIIQRNSSDVESIAPEYMLNLLDMVCIGALRSRDYVTYEKFLILYAVEAKKFTTSDDDFSYHDFIPSIDIADLYMCTNRLALARNTLLALKHKYQNYKKSVRISFLLRLNLSAMHFKSGDFRECVKLYNEIMDIGEKEILAELGFRVDIVFLTNIYGVIFYYENDDLEHAYYLITKLKRSYNTLLKSIDSIRELAFIKILEKIINNPSYLKSKTFAREYKKFIIMKRYDPADNEYISLNAWLTSKMTGYSYYACFLELVK